MSKLRFDVHVLFFKILIFSYLDSIKCKSIAFGMQLHKNNIQLHFFENQKIKIANKAF
jgi:hypothetical protein